MSAQRSIIILSVASAVAAAVSFVSADGPGNEIGHRYTKGFTDLQAGVDYQIDTLGIITMNDMSCSANAVRCNGSSVPCSQGIPAGTVCYVCSTAYQDRYCIPDPDEECVVSWTIDTECGAEKSGTCNASGDCVTLTPTGSTCHPKVCGA
jgi:hypothetical protein